MNNCGLDLPDIADQCQAESSEAYKLHAGNITVSVRVVQKCVEAAIKCYQDDHTECRKKNL